MVVGIVPLELDRPGEVGDRTIQIARADSGAGAVVVGDVTVRVKADGLVVLDHGTRHVALCVAAVSDLGGVARRLAILD